MNNDSTKWKLKPSNMILTAKEREWLNWAISGAMDVLDDDNWLDDNEDALTVSGQIEDMRYRLQEQAMDMVKSNGTIEQARADKRVLNSLNDKLLKSGYYTEKYHQ